MRQGKCMNVFSDQISKINNDEADFLVSFFHEELSITMVLKGDHRSSSVFWEERDPSNPNEVIAGPYVAIDFSYYRLLALGEDGKLKSWYYLGSQPIYPNIAFTSIAIGASHIMALRDD